MELRCANCRRVVGGVFHTSTGLLAEIYGWTSIPTYEEMLATHATETLGYSIGGYHGRWGRWGRRLDAFHYRPMVTFEPGEAGRCECFHQLQPIDWDLVNEAVARSRGSVRL